MQKFRQATTSSPPPKPMYQEIVVLGYGNGTEGDFLDAEMAPFDKSAKGTSRSGSTASQSGSSASSGLASTASPAETVASFITSPTSLCPDVSLDAAVKP